MKSYNFPQLKLRNYSFKNFILFLIQYALLPNFSHEVQYILPTLHERQYCLVCDISKQLQFGQNHNSQHQKNCNPVISLHAVTQLLMYRVQYVTFFMFCVTT